MLKILTVFGTRPEAIKMAPLIAELEKYPDVIENKNCITGQHKDMVESLIELFNIRVDYDLNLMRENQTLEHITIGVLQQVSKILREEQFDYLLVQGDTTTSMAASMAALYCGVKVGHVEAGLRTFNKYHPYPEEVNRKIIDSLSDLYFAHTEMARQHLLNEGVPEDHIAVTGNTVIDALIDVSNRDFDFSETIFGTLPFDTRRVILVTAHRRENFGGPFEAICEGLKQLALKYKDDIVLVYPVHRNPNVRKVVNSKLANIDNVLLIDPLDYMPMVHVMKNAYMVLTDSGGLQEEAPSLGKPVLVMRKVTERQEGVDAGTVKVIGMDAHKIVEEASRLLDDEDAYRTMAECINPYGDGTASVQIVQRLLQDCTTESN